MAKTEQTAADADAIARTHPAVDALRNRRGRPLIVRPSAPHRGEKEGSQLVAYFDYDENASVVAVVDAKAKTVISAEQVPVTFQLSDLERREAEALAARDVRVIEKLRGRDMNPLTRLYFPRKTSSDARRHRFAIVFLRPNNHERCYAIVDLSSNAVVDVLTRDALTGR